MVGKLAVTRRSHIERNTRETQIELDLYLDGSGEREIRTPVPFLNHMLEAFARHGVYDLRVKAAGDIEIDAHHTVEDVGLVLGAAFKESLGAGEGLVRYGWATIPMDETLVTCAVDFCGRPAFSWKVGGISGRWVGAFDCDLAKEFFAAFANRAECNLHILLHYGENAHHIIEAIFKAFARATDAATRIDDRLLGQIPSTKGTLTA
jgi:imidazoleglycerol-phosphate dehydratase